MAVGTRYIRVCLQCNPRTTRGQMRDGEAEQGFRGGCSGCAVLPDRLGAPAKHIESCRLHGCVLRKVRVFSQMFGFRWPGAFGMA